MRASIKKFFAAMLLWYVVVVIIFAVMNFLVANSSPDVETASELATRAAVILLVPLSLAFPIALFDVLGAGEMIIWAISRDKQRHQP